MRSTKQNKKGSKSKRKPYLFVRLSTNLKKQVEAKAESREQTVNAYVVQLLRGEVEK